MYRLCSAVRRSFGALGRSVGASFVCLVLLTAGCSESTKGDACELEDMDGVIGGSYTFALTIDDTKFDPLILTAQNSATVTLTLTNNGTAESGFSVDCLATPNDDGCPTSSCFPQEAQTGLIAPGTSKTIEFVLPEVEGIYTFRSVAGDDARVGQFILQ